MQSTTILQSQTSPALDDMARPVAHGLMQGDFALGQRTSRASVATGDFATGQRRTATPATLGTFATGLRSAAPSTMIGDFASGMRTVHAAPVIDHERTVADGAMPLAA